MQVVVVGAGLGGLSAAIHARLAGHSVLVLEQREAIGGKAAAIADQGFRFDPGPSIVILIDHYRAIFEAAGRKMEDILRFERLDPITRLYFEGRDMVDLPAGTAACTELVKQIAPSDHASFVALLERLEKAAPLVRDSIFRAPIDQPWHLVQGSMAKFARLISPFSPYKNYIDQHFSSPVLRAFFYGFPSYGGQSYLSASPGSLLIPHYMLSDGVYWPIGGIGAIPRALHQLAVDLGVEFRVNQRVTNLDVKNDRVRSLTLASGERVEAEAFISNRDRLAVEEMLGQLSTVKPSYSYFTVHWGLRKSVPGLKHHTLLVPSAFEPGFEQLYRERKFPDAPIVYLNETTEADPSTAPKGGGNLFAVVTSPAMEDHIDWPTFEAEAKRRVLGELTRHRLDFDPEDVIVERVQTPATFAQRDGNYRGSLYGADERHRLWGFMPMRVRDEKIKNLFYAGGSVQPGAGMPLVVLSGKFAAAQLQKLRR